MALPQHQTSWFLSAAYIYVLRLDMASLAWEYLRRNPDYRNDWQRYGSNFEHDLAAAPWGLCRFEDPDQDARVALPAWLLGRQLAIHVDIDAYEGAEASVFSIWDCPGRKVLYHDGRRLSLFCQTSTHFLQISLPRSAHEGMRCQYRIPLQAIHSKHAQRSLEWMLLHSSKLDSQPAAVSATRPIRVAIMHMRALQALDGCQAGASQRAIASAIFGEQDVAKRWSPDGELRNTIRNLLRRGRVIMQGEFHQLLRQFYS